MKKLFNTGSELAILVLHSNVLEELLKWNSKNEADTSSSSSSSSPRLRHITVEDNPKWTAISFATSPAFADKKPREGSGLVKSTVQDKRFELFKFLRGKADFAIDEAAIDLFHEHRDELSELRDRIIEIINPKTDNNNKKPKPKPKPLIITGNSLGGSVASLFTLWLLDSVSFSGKKPPICITFGSPLIGDTDLQKALYKYTHWSSNFLNIASTQDPVLRDLGNYMPFGTFLLCSESGCSCFEVPETIRELLNKPASERNKAFDYGAVLGSIKRQAVFKKEKVDTEETIENPTHVGIVMQLSAIGLVPTKEMAEEIEKGEMKFQMGKRRVGPDKKLNEMKMNMAKLEWYIKLSKDQGTSYYDRYKDMRLFGDMNIQECVKRLINYWTDQIEETDMKPQAEGKTLRTRWLYSGLNYLRIVEPLYIAEYYHHHHHHPEEAAAPPSGYEQKGRLRHFKRLAELVAEAKEKEITENVEDKKKKYSSVPIEEKKKRVGETLTEDSLFWAKVEEAFISFQSMTREGATEAEKQAFASELKSFENYVVESVKNYDVSTEIFFDQSRFMVWWTEYNKAMGENYESKLKEIMVNDYKKYCTGKL